jgi:hypothetical protein
MSAPLEKLAFVAVNDRIHEQLRGVECRFDGIRRLNIFTGRTALDGYQVGIGLSINPDSSIEYHVRKERPKDFDGYLEGWDYPWGSDYPRALHGRVHESRVLLSSVHPNDIREARSMDGDDLRLIGLLLDKFEEAKVDPAFADTVR